MAFTINGIVRNSADTKPLPGIEITIKAIGSTPTPAIAQTRTLDPSGEFQFTGLVDHGEYQVVFPPFARLASDAKGHRVLVSGNPTADIPDLDKDITTALRDYELQAFSVAGQVLDNKGAGLDGVRVFLE